MRRFDGSRHGRFVGHVQCDGRDFIAEAIHQGLQSLCVTRGGGDTVAASQCGFRPHASEALGCSRNEPNFA
jgi:hypothetical protein